MGIRRGIQVIFPLQLKCIICDFICDVSETINDESDCPNCHYQLVLNVSYSIVIEEIK